MVTGTLLRDINSGSSISSIMPILRKSDVHLNGPRVGHAQFVACTVFIDAIVDVLSNSRAFNLTAYLGFEVDRPV